MKKAQSHVDWIVSLGIFMIYIVMLFIFVKPGFQPINEGAILLNILEGNFRTNDYWNMTEVPLYISTKGVSKDTCSKVDPNTGDYKTGNYPAGSKNYYLELNFPFPKIGASNGQYMFITDASNKYLQSQFQSISCGDTTTTPPQPPCPNIFDFQAGGISPGQSLPYTYTLLYDSSNTIDYASSQNPIFKPVYECIVGNSCTPITTSIASGSNCFTYNFGIPVTLTGLSENYLRICTDATCYTRPNNNFPPQNSYNLTVYDLKYKSLFSYQKPGSSPILQSTAVYVKQWNDFILENDSSLRPVIVNIRVW